MRVTERVTEWVTERVTERATEGHREGHRGPQREGHIGQCARPSCATRTGRRRGG